MKKTLILCIFITIILSIQAETIFFYDFDSNFDYYFSWEQQRISGLGSWSLAEGGHNDHPPTAHSNSRNAFFFYPSTDGNSSRMVLPEMDLANYNNLYLRFWICKEAWFNDSDLIEVQKKTTENGSWQNMYNNIFDIYDWSYIEVPLGTCTSTTEIGFAGTAYYGFGICIDDIEVVGTPIGPGMATSPLPDIYETDVSLTTDLSWSTGSNSTTAEVLFDTVSPPTNVIYSGSSIASLSNAQLGGPLMPGVTYYWKVNSGNGTLTTNGMEWAFTTELGTATLPYSEGFETGLIKFNNYSQNNTYWQIGSEFYCEGSQAAFCAYEANDENILFQTSSLDLSAHNNAILTFKHIAKTEANGDNCLIEYTTDDGNSWTGFAPAQYLGSSENYSGATGFSESSYIQWEQDDTVDNSWWQQEMFDLTDFANESSFSIRFRLTANSSIQKAGWFIDDINIAERGSSPQIQLSTHTIAKTIAQESTDSEPLVLENTGDMDLIYHASVTGPATRDILMEDFEGASFPSDGWNLYRVGAQNYSGWQRTSSTSHSPTKSIYHADSNYSGMAEDWIVTPLISLGVDNSLNFWEKNQYVDSYQYYTYHGVWISTGSGDPNDGEFVELQEFGVHTPNWTQRTIDLSDYNSSDVYIGFYYRGDYDSIWRIDDIDVSGGLETPWLTLDGSFHRNGYLSSSQTELINVHLDSDGLDVGTYTARIIVDHNGSTPSETVNVTMDVVSYQIVAPSNVVVEVLGDVLTLNWDAVDGAVGYRVYFADTPDSDYILAPNGETVNTSWSVNVTEGKEFYFIKSVFE